MEANNPLYCTSRGSVVNANAYFADPLASNFSPESVHDLPVELSQWLHLFYAYLQVEQAHADVLASLGRTGVPKSLATASFISQQQTVMVNAQRGITCWPDLVWTLQQ